MRSGVGEVGRAGGGGGGGGGGRPPFDGDVRVELGEADPGGDVGFVVEAGEDDLGSGGEGGEDLGEVGEELGCAGADYCCWQRGGWWLAKDVWYVVGVLAGGTSGRGAAGFGREEVGVDEGKER